MASNEYLKYESQVYAHLSLTLADIGWTLKREYSHNGYMYDLALFYNETLYTFIEIKYSKKTNFSRIKKSGELYIRKCPENIFNYGILFMNGKLFIVGKNTSKHIKAFPDISAFEWRKDVNRPYLCQLAEDYVDDYNEESIPVYSALLELERKDEKIKKLEE